MSLRVICRQDNGPWHLLTTVIRADQHAEQQAAQQELNSWEINWSRASEFEFKITGDWK